MNKSHYRAFLKSPLKTVLLISIVVAAVGVTFDLFAYIDSKQQFLIYINVFTLLFIIVSLILLLINSNEIQLPTVIFTLAIVFSILISDIHLLAQKDPLWQYYFLRDTFIFVFFLAFIGLLLSQVYAYILNCVYCISVIIIWYMSDESFVNDNAIFLLLMMTGYAFATGLFSKKLKSSFKKNNELNSLLVQKDKEILEKENERVIEQVRLLKEMIEIKNKELMSRAMLLTEQIESNTRSAKKLDELEEYIAPEKITELKSIARDIRSENNLHWEEFLVRFKDVHQNFYANLEKEYTNLTPAEIKLAAFIKLKLSSKQIAILTNNTQGSIEVARSRLRKKLGLQTSHNIIDFLDKF